MGSPAIGYQNGMETSIFVSVCRKTPNDVLESHPSNIETAAQMENIQHLSSPSCPPHVEAVRESVHHVEAVMERAHHGGGWLLSGILCINILILGCALVSGSASNSVAITAVHRQIFLIILLLLTMLWMLFYMAFTSRKDQAVVFRDSHAGPVWLRGENFDFMGLKRVSFQGLITQMFIFQPDFCSSGFSVSSWTSSRLATMWATFTVTPP